LGEGKNIFLVVTNTFCNLGHLKASQALHGAALVIKKGSGKKYLLTLAKSKLKNVRDFLNIE
jgi:hypothetical protein